MNSECFGSQGKKKKGNGFFFLPDFAFLLWEGRGKIAEKTQKFILSPSPFLVLPFSFLFFFDNIILVSCFLFFKRK